MSFLKHISSWASHQEENCSPSTHGRYFTMRTGPAAAYDAVHHLNVVMKARLNGSVCKSKAFLLRSGIGSLSHGASCYYHTRTRGKQLPISNVWNYKKKRVSGLWRNKSTSFFFFLDSNTTFDFTNEQTEFLNHSLQCMVCILAASMTGLMSV